jgi:hypothetical protein
LAIKAAKSRKTVGEFIGQNVIGVLFVAGA